MNNTDDPAIQSASTRAAGISALRKIRQLVDEENDHDRIKAYWAKRIAFLASAVILLLVLVFLLKRF